MRGENLGRECADVIRGAVDHYPSKLSRRSDILVQVRDQRKQTRLPPDVRVEKFAQNRIENRHGHVLYKKLDRERYSKHQDQECQH